jgi:hypothetical protein
MIDHWFGKVVTAVDDHEQWDSTAIVVCTDHGHYLGEHDHWGKPAVPVMQTLGHIPLLVHWPGAAPATVDALTTSVDLHATIADVFGVAGTERHRTHGRSLVPVLDGSLTSVRDSLLTGVWGREVHLVNGREKYCRAPAGENAPISMFSNRWSTMPTPLPEHDMLPLPDHRAYLDRMPGSDVPVIRQPWDASDNLPFWSWGDFRGSHLWDVVDDPDEEHDLAASGSKGDPDATPSTRERDLMEQLRVALLDVEAPDDQLVRLGLD